MYDKTPVYPHHASLFWAHEPYKTIYVLQRILTTLLLVPVWVTYYGILPRSFRPRPSWSISQIVVVKFMKRISRVTEVAGVTWGTRDPTTAPDERSLKETRFVWVPALSDELKKGIVDDEHVECKPVGTYVWPKHPLPSTHFTAASSPPEKIASETSGESSSSDDDIEALAADAPSRIIGIFLHGGGYCHYSAHEQAGTSRVPRRLVKDGLFREIHAVEYRLLQHAPVPGALQDAAAVYANVVINELGATKGVDGKYHYPERPSPIEAQGKTSDKLDRAEAQAQERGRRPDHVPLPQSTATSPTRHARSPSAVQPMLSGNDQIPTITVTTESGTTADAKVRFPKPAQPRTKIVLIGDSAGGNLVLALARWIRDEDILPAPDGMLLLSPSCDPSHTLPQVPASRRPRPHESTDYLLDTPEPRALLQRTFLGHHPIEFVYSPYVSPSSEWVLNVFHGPQAFEDLETMENIRAGDDTRAYREGPGDVEACRITGPSLSVPRPDAPGRTQSTNPFIRDPSGLGLFTNFPRALITVGDAERLEREVVALEKGMERDGVRVRMVWAKDGVHDLLILAKWDETVREGIWEEIARWIKEIEQEP
ncbi:hypothetical protein OF83DRAFT_1111163 [Amylostereum chailletii]|nr:hypothetical protein OF83DRAFT_1111163 [Amylostereum chailletii]